MVATQTVALHKLGSSGIDGADLIVGIFLLILLINKMNKHNTVSFTLLDILGILLLSCVVLSASIGGVGALLRGITIALKVLILTFLLCNFIYKKETLVFFIKWFIIITSMSAVIGIFQEIIYISSGVVVAGVVEKDTLKLMFEPTSFGTLLRIPAFTGFYKNLTYLLIPCIIIVFNLIIYNFRQLSFTTKALLLLSLFLTGSALLLTFSKDSYLAVFIAILFSFIVRWPNRIIHVSLVFLVLLVIIYYAGLFDDIYNAFYAELHWQEYRMRLQLFREGVYGFIYCHPWLGAGYNQSPLYTADVLFWPPHNAFLNAACEMGLIGLIPYLLLIGYTLFSAWSLSLVVTELQDKAITIGLLIGIIGNLISMQFHGTYITPYLWQLMGVVQAYRLVVSKGKDNNIVSVSKEMRGSGL
jgi:O-antigen ligase